MRGTIQDSNANLSEMFLEIEMEINKEKYVFWGKRDRILKR